MINMLMRVGRFFMMRGGNMMFKGMSMAGIVGRWAECRGKKKTDCVFLQSV